MEGKSAPCRVPNVPLYDVPRREAQNASAISDGAKRTSNEPCRHAAIRPARRRAPTSSDAVSPSISNACWTAASSRGSAPCALPTSVIHALRASGSRERARSTSSAFTLPEPSQRSEEHTSELQSLMLISYAVFCLKKKKPNKHTPP